MECEKGTPPPRTAEGGDLEEEQVMSEVHLGCPPNHPGRHVSYFTISPPTRDEQMEDSLGSVGAKVCEVDEDGDLILPRRRAPDTFVISIQHNITSSIPSVGLQVWRAELVLADFVLHMIYNNSSNFQGIVALELGAGTGLVGMLLARVANTVFITDRGDEVLGNCVENVDLNSRIFHRKASVHVRELDWSHPWPPKVLVNSPSDQSYGWSMSEVEELQRASLLLAADVIYSDDLTDAFFSVLEVIMSNSPEKVLYVALEKRYNFSINDLDIVANGYSHFCSYLQDDEEEGYDALKTNHSRSFIGKLIDLDEIPQYIQEYDRGSDIELWQIKYKKLKS